MTKILHTPHAAVGVVEGSLQRGIKSHGSHANLPIWSVDCDSMTFQPQTAASCKRQLKRGKGTSE